MTNTLFKQAQQIYSNQEIASFLGLHVNTVERWILLDNVPPNYYLDFARMLNLTVDYSSLTYQQKDQFFTTKENTQFCVNTVKKVLTSYGVNLDKYHWIEPSAGDGVFLSFLPSSNQTALDIEPMHPSIKKADYLKWHPKTENNIVIGNPPFGLRGHLALQFINHSFKFADFVCFILPQLFESEGKGSAKKRVNGYNLIYSTNIPNNFRTPNGPNTVVNVIFQIWAKHIIVKETAIDMSNEIKIYSLSDGGKPSNTRNKKWLDQCDYYLPSTCFGAGCMQLYPSFYDLPNQRGYGIVLLNKNNSVLRTVISNIQWSNVAFNSTNNAYNLRTDLITKAIFIPYQTELSKSE
jgi:hypothetical protein